MFVSIQQIQFVICIGHTVRALCISCEFPAFMSFLLLLNSSIFFVMFMNFYVHSYNKKTAAPALAATSTTPAPMVAKKID